MNGGLFEDIKPEVKKLYRKGVLEEADLENCVAVVGSRKMTSYGKTVLEKIIPSLCDVGITIVSGFMYGVDQEAHKIALSCGGKTVAVLGWGIDWKVPFEDQKLYSEIQKKGLIISEYEGAAKYGCFRSEIGL